MWRLRQSVYDWRSGTRLESHAFGEFIEPDSDRECNIVFGGSDSKPHVI